jgi:hypothetical protein
LYELLSETLAQKSKVLYIKRVDSKTKGKQKMKEIKKTWESYTTDRGGCNASTEWELDVDDSLSNDPQHVFDSIPSRELQNKIINRSVIADYGFCLSEPVATLCDDGSISIVNYKNGDVEYKNFQEFFREHGVSFSIFAEELLNTYTQEELEKQGWNFPSFEEDED